MANRVYISILETPLSFVSPCTEDIQVQAKSDFTRIGELIPGIETLVKLLQTGSAVISSEVSSSMTNAQNALDVPIWNKTNPVTITMDLNFFLKTSGYYDVWVPTMTLQSMSILSVDFIEGGLITPGLNVSTINTINNYQLSPKSLDSSNNFSFASAEASQGVASVPEDVAFTMNSKVCAVYIPGIVYLPMAMVETCQPTWSKQLTDQGFPIWSKVNIQFTGLYPAIFENNFSITNPNLTSFIVGKV